MFSLPQHGSSVKRRERGMRLRRGSVERRGEKKADTVQQAGGNPDGVTTSQCDSQQSSSLFPPLLSLPTPSFLAFLCMKLMGKNSNMPNIHHPRLCYDCGASGYDEYGGSGAEE
jgi:hypothetical protein